jgi:formylmethanofuran dehydrogenase subunit C
MPLNLRWKGRTSVAVEAGLISPSRLCRLKPEEASRLEVSVGGESVRLSDLFEISGSGEDFHLIVEGDLSQVHGLASGMDSGKLTIRGDVGFRLARGMSGGEVEVFGSVGHWALAEMRGGIARMHGHVGDDLGAALPGSRRGMNDGVILVSGSVGSRCGAMMRRGLIAILGNAEEMLGNELIAGSIFVFGFLNRLAGLGMKRGTIVAFGEGTPILPTFELTGRFRPPFINIYLKQLESWGFFPGPNPFLQPAFDRYNGDLVRGGQGELLIRRS